MQNLKFTHHGRFNCEYHNDTLHDGRNFYTNSCQKNSTLKAKCLILKTPKGSCCLRMDINSKFAPLICLISTTMQKVFVILLANCFKVNA